MTDEFFTGSWTGHYVYGEIYGERKGERCDFRMELILKDGILNGHCDEEVTEKLMGAPAMLSGFIEGGMISMIKQYPCLYFTNEKGEMGIDRSKSHWPVHYTGGFDPQTNCFSGKWEIEIVLQKDFFGGSYAHFATGTWEMQKRPA